jgi:hypothetical protein
MPTKRARQRLPNGDRKQLSDFLAKVEALLKKIATKGTYFGKVVIPKGLHSKMRAAWKEVAATFAEVHTRVAA